MVRKTAKTAKTKKSAAKQKPQRPRRKQKEIRGQKRSIKIEEPHVHEVRQRLASQKQTDGFAIAAFVAGLFGFLIPFLNIAALVFGIIAIRNIHRHTYRKGHGLAIVGMLLGLASLLLFLIADVVSMGGFSLL